MEDQEFKRDLGGEYRLEFYSVQTWHLSVFYNHTLNASMAEHLGRIKLKHLLPTRVVPLTKRQ